MEKITLQDFENIVNCIEKNVNYFERTLEPNRYYMNLANGERLNIVFPKSNIGHLLGIKVDGLRASGIVRIDTPIYEIIRKLIDADLTYQGLVNKNFPVESLFSDYIAKKLEIFTEIVKIRTDDLLCIVKYYSDRTYDSTENVQNCDYFIIRKHDEEVYSALGIKLDNNNNNKYIPVTSRLFCNKKELNEFLASLKKQEVTYPTSFTIDNYEQDYHKTFYTTLESKLRWCKFFKNLSSSYNLVPVNNNDVLFILEKFMNSNRDNDNNISVINSIVENIKNGSIIDKSYFMESLGIRFMSEEVVSLIDAINDYIYSKSSFSVSSEFSYSNLQKQLEESEEEKNKYKKELRKSQEELRKAKKEIEEMRQKLALANQGLNVFEDS